MGITMSTFQRSTGRSSSSTPMSIILLTYSVEPASTKPTYTRLSSTTSTDTARRGPAGSSFTSASTPMWEPTRTPEEMPAKIMKATQTVVSSSVQEKPVLKT